MTDLEKARLIINEADKEMAQLFEKRMDAARIIGEYKKEHGLPVEDVGREETIIERNSAYVENEEYRSYYVNFLQSAIELSKKLQHRIFDGMRVAYSGVEGAFANIVTKRVFPDAKAVACSDFAAAYNAVVNGDCDCALLPIENSYNGDVGNVMDLAFFGSLYVTGVYEAEIVQNLLAVKGASVGDIKTVISHPQALGQCATYIEKHGFEAVEAVNTAVAAKEVARMGRVDIAAIGSEEAAEQFGLVKLESHINQSSQNTTRFAVFSRTPRMSNENKHFIMLFTVNNTAGSLGKAVSIIGEYGINLRALKSRPTKELVWDYYFYAEGEGNINSARAKEMIEKLENYCNYLKILGSYEKEVRV
ncbi:MAG: bifunctional chorismate mutase/prephenate dehydratase [Clostridiales bacterium]|nr:bifunctional chorismate mutase/prephenate dehydratase [Clostridiales bacterium]